MKISLLTYDISHLKTAQICMGLVNAGQHELSFLTVPFNMRPKRETLLQHRPEQFVGISVREMSAAFDLPIYTYDEREQVLEENDYLLICGANILEASFANSGKIINGHAGIIPHVRGLDSFKWAILDGLEIGNTLHIIDEHADFGKVLHQLKTPLFTSDTIEHFAARHYSNEIWMLTHFDLFLDEGEIFQLPENKARKRMKRETEEKMLQSFEEYKERFAIA